MKLIFGWILFSSILSLTIVLNAHKVIPAGEHTEKYIVTNTELHILKELLKKDSVNKDEIQSLINEKTKHFKGVVIGYQLESIPMSFIYLALLILNALNILFVLISSWYIRNNAITKSV